MRKATPSDNLKISHSEISKEWHPTKNGNLKPEKVLKKSNKRVWWLCVNNHEWKAVIATRTVGGGCPHCNSLKFLFPEIAKEWHPTKNINLKPEDVTKVYYKKVWWKCKKDHEWLAAVSSRTKRIRPSNCPYCINHYSTRRPKNPPIK